MYKSLQVLLWLPLVSELWCESMCNVILTIYFQFIKKKLNKNVL